MAWLCLGPLPHSPTSRAQVTAGLKWAPEISASTATAAAITMPMPTEDAASPRPSLSVIAAVGQAWQRQRLKCWDGVSSSVPCDEREPQYEKAGTSGFCQAAQLQRRLGDAVERI